MNAHLIAVNAVFFILTIPTDKHSGLTLMQPWAEILMHQWMKASPTPFSSESYSCFKGWKHGMILPLEENSEFKDHQIFFSLKKKTSSVTLSNICVS